MLRSNYYCVCRYWSYARNVLKSLTVVICIISCSSHAQHVEWFGFGIYSKHTKRQTHAISILKIDWYSPWSRQKWKGVDLLSCISFYSIYYHVGGFLKDKFEHLKSSILPRIKLCFHYSNHILIVRFWFLHAKIDVKIQFILFCEKNENK